MRLARNLRATSATDNLPPRRKPRACVPCFDDDGYDSVIDNDGNLDELVRRFLDILPDVQIVVAAGALPYVASTISTAGGRMFGEPYISVDGKTALFRADLPVPLKVSLLQNPNVFEISPVQYFSPS